MFAILETIKTRPELAVILAALSSMIIYQLKTIPQYLWTLYTRFFTINLEVDSQCQAFFLLNKWLAQQNFSNRNRNLQLSRMNANPYCDDTEVIMNSRKKEFPVNWKLTNGFGFYIFFYKRTLVVYTKTRRNLENKTTSLEIISGKLTAFTRSKKILFEIMDCLLEYTETTEGTPIHNYSNQHWECSEKRKVRPLDSVTLATGQMQRIVSGIEKFYTSKEHYISKGIPYRKGHLFSGPPGTGKTSVLLALAAHFKKKVYIINLSGALSDSEIFSAITQTENDCFIVIEDIDCIKAMHTRSNVADTGDGKANGIGVTTQGLLNILDGITTPENRLYFMTTNHPSKLDPAFLRPGRVDVHEVLDNLNKIDQERMANFFYEKDGFIGMDFAVSPAELQKAFMLYSSNPKRAAQYLLENKDKLQ